MIKNKKQNLINNKSEKSEDSNLIIYTLILIFFFISGLTGLIYEILWTRLITKIIGGSPFAVSIVLTVFMGGLGLGSYIASRIIGRIKNPINLVKLYGALELVIAIYGLSLPLLLILFKPIFVILYNHLFNHFFIYNIFTFIGCSILLLLPVICMGATLPVLSHFYITKISHVGSHLGQLYGINTIGGAAGSLICGFWIIFFWGVQGSLIFAVILNIIIGSSCIILSYMTKGYRTIPEKVVDDVKTTQENTISEIAKITGLAALIIFSVSGFCAMAYEVIWTKLLGLLVGPTTYSFTIVLITFITGLALGSLFFGWMADKVKKVFFLLLFTQIAAALSALFISQVIGNSQIFFAKLIYHLGDNFTYLIILKSLILFFFMFFPTFFLGATFPLVGKIYTHSISHVGKSVGFAYSINTLGAVLGSFFAGFFLIPLMGKENSLRLIIDIQLMIPLIIGSYIFWKSKQKITVWIPLVLPVFLGLILSLPYPRWNRKMLSIGKYQRFELPEIKKVSWFKALFYGTEMFSSYNKGEVVYFGDGIGGFTTVTKGTDLLENVSYTLLNSGKPDASSLGDDMCTQTLSAHFPMLFHPNPKNVMVLGLASGITAGEILYYPVERLDVIEINNQTVSASNFFKQWNNNFLSNPKTELIIQDGRAHLELTRQKYDVIVSEPSNPWMAGVSILFTKDFFELAKKRLNNDGIFVQWIHAYQTDWSNFAMIGRTFAEIFPNSLIVRTDPKSLGADFLLIGLNGEKGLDINTAKQNLTYAKQSKNATIVNHKLFYGLIVSEDLLSLFGEGPVNTDNWPRLEFSAPVSMYDNDQSILINMAQRGRLSKETLDIIHTISTNVDDQIDYAAYALSFEIPFQKMVNLSIATPSQKERFFKLMETYFKNNVITDFSFLDDEDLKKKFISVQIESVREKINFVSDKATAYEHLGSLCIQNRLLDDALIYYNEMLKINPNHPDNFIAHYNIGNIFSSKGNTTEAINHYRESLSLNPNSPQTHKNLGLTLQKIGMTTEGKIQIQEAIRLEQESNQLDSH